MWNLGERLRLGWLVEFPAVKTYIAFQDEYDVVDACYAAFASCLFPFLGGDGEFR